jgi:hypothetical protein
MTQGLNFPAREFRNAFFCTPSMFAAVRHISIPVLVEMGSSTSNFGNSVFRIFMPVSESQQFLPRIAPTIENGLVAPVYVNLTVATLEAFPSLISSHGAVTFPSYSILPNSCVQLLSSSATSAAF